jgi:hypothetical protein
MAIAGTPTDIQTMVNHTSSQNGCAFACHEANPAADNLGNPGGEDNYTLAKNLGVKLRADLLDAAITDLTNTAYNAEHNPSIPVEPSYRMSINSFDVNFNPLVPLMSDFVSTWSTQLATMKANDTQTLEVRSNSYACSPTTKKVNKSEVTETCGAGVYDNDTDTNYDAAMSGITALMPVPGNGANRAGDTPQEILFIVTDGVEDENVAGDRQQSTMVGTKDWCTPLKTKGIKIAILYTEYFPLPTNPWYNTYIAPIHGGISPTLQNCAASGLFYEVGMRQDISSALQELFQSAVASAHLIN